MWPHGDEREEFERDRNELLQKKKDVLELLSIPREAYIHFTIKTYKNDKKIMKYSNK